MAPKKSTKASLKKAGTMVSTAAVRSTNYYMFTFKIIFIL
jgi:hypothetical protein